MVGHVWEGYPTLLGSTEESPLTVLYCELYRLCEYICYVVDILPYGMVLVFPCLEPLSHFLDFLLDRVLAANLWRYVWEWNRLDSVIRFACPVRPEQTVVVVPRTELHPVQDPSKLSHTDRTDVIGVLMDGQDSRRAQVAVRMVRLWAVMVVPHLFHARVAIRSDSLLDEHLLQHNLPGQRAHRLPQHLYLFCQVFVAGLFLVTAAVAPFPSLRVPHQVL